MQPSLWIEIYFADETGWAPAVGELKSLIEIRARREPRLRINPAELAARDRNEYPTVAIEAPHKAVIKKAPT